MKTRIDPEFGGKYVEIPFDHASGEYYGAPKTDGPTEIIDGNSLAKFLLNTDSYKIAVWRHKVGIPSNLPTKEFTQ